MPSSRANENPSISQNQKSERGEKEFFCVEGILVHTHPTLKLKRQLFAMRYRSFLLGFLFAQTVGSVTHSAREFAAHSSCQSTCAGMVPRIIFQVLQLCNDSRTHTYACIHSQ